MVFCVAGQVRFYGALFTSGKEGIILSGESMRNFLLTLLGLSTIKLQICKKKQIPIELVKGELKANLTIFCIDVNIR